MSKTLYNLKTNHASPDLPFTITKFDSDLNVESSYSVGNTLCSCPAGHRPKCRHRDMLPTLRQRIDTAWFWCFETRDWQDPTGEASQEVDAQEEHSTEVSDPVEGDGRFDEGLTVHPRAHAQSLEGAFESGAIKLIPTGNPAPNPQIPAPFKRRV